MTAKKVFNLLLVAVLVVLFIVGRKGFNRESLVPPPHDNSPAGLSESSSASIRQPNRLGKTGYENCPASGSACDAVDFSEWVQPLPGSCHVRMSNGYPLPDPRCTPGGKNPSISLAVLRDASWRTRCIRNCRTSEAEKHVAYSWYGIQKPAINSQENQICELDHLVPLELGGSDALANIWPQCGPDSVTLNERYFKAKDRVERYVAREVKSGRLQLDVAQKRIADDWTQFLEASGT